MNIIRRKEPVIDSGNHCRSHCSFLKLHRQSEDKESGGDIMRSAFHDILIDCPVIAAVKDDEGLEKCLESESQIVFILYGDLIRIPQMVKKIKDAGNYIKQETLADGIISTKMAIVKRAKELGLVTVFRFFVIDSMAFDNIRKQYHTVQPDVVEILPGLMPKIITKVSKLVSCPVIAGGLIADKADIIGAIEAGATAISSTNQKTWFI